MTSNKYTSFRIYRYLITLEHAHSIALLQHTTKTIFLEIERKKNDEMKLAEKKTTAKASKL